MRILSPAKLSVFWCLEARCSPVLTGRWKMTEHGPWREYLDTGQWQPGDLYCSQLQREETHFIFYKSSGGFRLTEDMYSRVFHYVHNIKVLFKESPLSVGSDPCSPIIFCLLILACILVTNVQTCVPISALSAVKASLPLAGQNDWSRHSRLFLVICILIFQQKLWFLGKNVFYPRSWEPRPHKYTSDTSLLRPPHSDTGSILHSPCRLQTYSHFHRWLF